MIVRQATLPDICPEGSEKPVTTWPARSGSAPDGAMSGARRCWTSLLRKRTGSRWTQTAIANQCGVSREFVSRVTHDLTCDRITSEDDPKPIYRKYRDRAPLCRAS